MKIAVSQNLLGKKCYLVDKSDEAFYLSKSGGMWQLRSASEYISLGLSNSYSYEEAEKHVDGLCQNPLSSYPLHPQRG